MEEHIILIWRKLERIHYLAQNKPNVQVLKLIPEPGKKVNDEEREQVVAWLKNKFTPGTEIDEVPADGPTLVICIKIPSNQDYQAPLRRLKEEFKKTP